MLELYTDGACSNGNGGWAVIQKPYAKNELLNKEVSWSGREQDTTNNRMELQAILVACAIARDLKLPTVIYTDSMYSIKAITVWFAGWLNNGWKTANKKPVKNRELIEAIHEIYDSCPITFKHVKGHNGDEFNEKVDKLAVQERLKL